jgi:hypothetical protein
MRQHDDGELDVSRIAAACEQRLAARCPGDSDLAVRTLARLTPDRWTLEWYLPWWLAASFGLDRALAVELVESNVLGLVAIRLEDDLIDDEVARSDLASAGRLMTAALDEALDLYRRRLPASSPLWPFLDRTLTAWRRASASPEGPDELASLGAPLKVTAYGICLLGARPDAWPRLERCLDLAMSALVRYDQVSDWEADVAAGRGNAFVTAIGSRSQLAVLRGERHAAMLVALLTTDAARDAFRRINADATAAARLAESVGCEPLAAFLSRYAIQATSEGAAIATHYQDVARQVTSLIFGNAPTPAT